MRFLFLYTSYNKFGGIETLIWRMHDWLTAHGHEVTLVVDSLAVARPHLPAEMRIIEIGERYHCLVWCHEARRFLTDAIIQTPDVIKCFDIKAAWIAAMLAVWSRPAPKVLLGDYMPACLLSADPGRWWRNLLPRLYLRNASASLPPSARLFMAQEQMINFRKVTGTRDPGRLQLLSVDSERYRNVTRRPQPGVIVSIGRLDHMKGYNLHMIDAVAKLRQDGHDVRWIVHGDGILRDKMVARISEKKLGQWIELRGPLDYARMGVALENAFVFVGMGTTVVEAAFCGVPAVVAIAFDETGGTHGPLWRQSLGNLGEPDDSLPVLFIADEIKRVLALDSSGYADECLKTKLYADAYSMSSTMGTLMERIEETEPPRKPYLLVALSYVVWLRNFFFRSSGRELASA